jgi:hypothetical protein
MLSIRTKARRTSLVFAAALVTLFFPGMAFAEGTGDASTETTSAQTTGPQQPTGADGKTFHYNSETGKWENEHYIWDPVTKQTTLKDPNYTYDPESGRWSTSDWKYDTPSGKYQEVKKPAPAPAPSENNDDTQGAAANGSAGGSQSHATSTTTGGTATAIANGVTSTAISGNATVAYNTLGGNATSGNSTVTSNTMNLLQSGISLSGGSAPTTFVADIGDWDDDIVIDPSLFVVQPAGSATGLPDTKLTVVNDTGIHNDINLAAATGNATVDSNTAAGNATSGNAHAVANVSNLVNSNISAGGAFVGVININGNLDGDILFPDGFLESLMASNTPTLTLDTTLLENGDLKANFTNNTDIANNVNTHAASGAATVANNTSAGNATSGKSNTNVTIFNLTGHEVVGENSVLVFVNVLGKWVGVILDAPNGTTAAAVGNGSASARAGDTEVNATNNTKITNDVDVNAVSGDASVTNNTSAGNATSGDATASANILNVSNSNVSLSGWFGILFINVFGSWNGSFGVDTEAGEHHEESGGSTTGQGGGSTNNNLVSQVFGAVSGNKTTRVSSASYQQTSAPEEVATVQSASDDKKEDLALNTTTQDPSKKTSGNSAWTIVALGAFVAGALLLLERLWSMRQQKSA